LREEYKLKVFENRVLRKILGPKKVGVTGGWRSLHNEKLHNLHCSPIVFGMFKSRRMRWAKHVAHMGESRDSYRVLVGKTEERRPLEKN
jgi:hypothetical protein